jgi:hypothetical protein
MTMAAEVGRSGEDFIASCYVACHRCESTLYIEWLNAAGARISFSTGTSYNAGAGSNGGTDLANWARLTATGTAPAGTQSVRLIVQFEGNGNGTPYGWLIRPMLERKRATQTLPSEWNAGGVEMFASHTLKLDVNGYVTGWTFGNDGTTGDFTITVDSFRLVTPGQSPKTPFAMTGGNVHINADLYMGNGRIISVAGGYMKVQGSGFGSSNQFVEWWGPYNANLATCTEANATYYLKTNGSAYFGGSLAAGVLKNAARTTVISTTASVETGNFGTNGASKSVVVSFDYYNSGTIAGNVVGTHNGVATTATVVLERSYNGGAWTNVTTLNATGTTTAVYDTETAQTSVVKTCAGSVTITDTYAGTLNFNYRVRVTAATGNWPITLNGVQGTQSTGLVSVEE